MDAKGGSIAHTVLGVLGNIITVAFFFTSTLRPVWEMVRKKTGGDILTNQLSVFIFFNCLEWVFYGLPCNQPNNFWVILTNAIGAFVSLIAVLAYYYYASKKDRIIIQCEMELFTALFVIIILMVLVVNKSHHIRVQIVGSISTVFSSCMHFALLSELVMAWKNRDMNLLHPIPSILGFIKGGLWTAYGWNAKDPFIVVPNAIAVATGVVQVILCIVFRQYLVHRVPLEKDESTVDIEASHS